MRPCDLDSAINPNTMGSHLTLPGVIIPETKFTGIDICTTCNFSRSQCICNHTTGTSGRNYCEFPRQGCTCGQHKEKEKNQKKEKSCYATYSTYECRGSWEVDKIGPVFMNANAASHYCAEMSEKDAYREWHYTKVDLHE